MKKIYNLTIISPNPDGIYRVGEKVNFYPQATIASVLVRDGRIRWQIIKNKMEPVADGEFLTDIIAACASCIADEPCCLECQMTFFPADGSAPVTAALGAAVDPFGIRPGLEAPADFDAFWNKQKKRLAAVPLKASLTPVKSGNFDCHDVKIDSVDNIPVSGLLMRSAATYKKKCPAVICLHGAGVKSARPENAFVFVEHDFLALDINAHGLPNLMPPDFYGKKESAELAGYWRRDFDSGDPDKVYFAGMFLVGLIDGSCCASSVYAAYNNYAGPKSIITAPWMPHAVEPAMARELIKFVIAQACKRRLRRSQEGAFHTQA